MNYPANRLENDFGTAANIHPGYEDFFSGLNRLTTNRTIDEELGYEIKKYVLDYVNSNRLAIDNFNDASYMRNYIGRNPETGWEAIVMTWKKGNRTAIHSHPQFASYTIADGEFLIEIFEPADDGTARLKDAVVVYDRQCFYAIGNSPDYNNHIHRITCLSDTGHSLHIYSGDALKGYKFDLKK